MFNLGPNPLEQLEFLGLEPVTASDEKAILENIHLELHVEDVTVFKASTRRVLTESDLYIADVKTV
ncbi:hypothetical protein [Listeria booriae]|uniref:hypothetical protein n=1 Tax=Listeria booriae TaxID=1552123 RepID=UPI0016270CB1|nr:hypothetical protein [Listeria booriae]MBC2190551.1 hypothetical protein [Listeria booriae]